MMLLARCALAACTGGTPGFTESYLDLRTEDFTVHAADLDGNDREDLLLSLREEDQRLLQAYRQGARGVFPGQPDWQMSLPPDAICFALADVRDEPGVEVLLLARSGVFSVSTTVASLRGNLRRECTMTLFPDLSEDGPLPRWNLVADLDGDGAEELLLLSDESLVVMARGEAGAPGQGLVERARLPCRQPLERGETRGARLGPGGFEEMQGQALALPYFPGAFSSRTAMPSERWLLHSRAWRLPALADWNGDGRRDALYRDQGGLELLEQDPSGSFEEAALRKVSLPGDEDDEDPWQARLVDFDQDGRVEVALTRSQDEDFLYLVLGRDPAGGIEERPRARIKLSSLGVTFEEEDVDQDGRLDVIARMVDIPAGVKQASGVRLDVTLLVYRGLEGARLDPRPALRFERTFRPEQLTQGDEANTLDLTGDFDGDGVHDLLLLQPDGLVEIHLLSAAAGGWSLSEEPLARFRPSSLVRSTEPVELSGDKVTDLILRHESALTVYVSGTGG